jgi:hypothetical protein
MPAGSREHVRSSTVPLKLGYGLIDQRPVKEGANAEDGGCAGLDDGGETCQRAPASLSCVISMLKTSEVSSSVRSYETDHTKPRADVISKGTGPVCVVSIRHTMFERS